MKVEELQLGDVVKVASQADGLEGQATIIGLDPTASTLQVMVGWNGDEAGFYKGRDNYSIIRAIYAPNAKTAFENSYWIDVEKIVSKLESGLAQPTVSAGMSCACCKNFNSYAEANLPNNRYGCYSCRTSGRIK